MPNYMRNKWACLLGSHIMEREMQRYYSFMTLPNANCTAKFRITKCYLSKFLKNIFCICLCKYIYVCILIYLPDPVYKLTLKLYAFDIHHYANFSFP